MQAESREYHWIEELIVNPEEVALPLDPERDYAWIVWSYDRASGGPLSPFDSDGRLDDLASTLRAIAVYNEVIGVTLFHL